MKIFVLLLLNLSFASSLLSQNIIQKPALDNRTKNFPKHIDYVNNMPAKHNLWVFVLAGQSNMAGRGHVKPADTLSDSRILSITKDRQWILAKEPLHFYEPKLTGLDCGLSFGREMLKHVPDSVSIALIPCAVGGSSIQQWLGDSLFRNVQLLSNFNDMLSFAKQYGSVKGILWHQGESDATSNLIPKYKQSLNKLILAFRNEAGNDHLPFLIGELGAFANPERQIRWDYINQIIHEVAAKDENAFVIGTEDLECKADSIHFNSVAQRSMGWRFARLFAG
ncbi:MAG: sialate O-acetylesterase, partial [Bacteroidales bacterium]|nr:sialate O-acetylesterase [Bacteroidales bacterium]